MQELIDEAEHELHFMAYLLTDVGVLNMLAGAVQRGVRVTGVINNLVAHPPSVREAIVQLARRSPGFIVMDFRDHLGSQLHAKILVADRTRGLVGSSNFSWSGLVGNHEVGILVEGDEAWALAVLVDTLAHRLQDEGPG
jgi:cardiolipin synthase